MGALRKAIRQEVVTILENGSTSAADRVFSSRVTPLFDVELPAILVYSNSENAQLFNEAPRRNKRTIRLAVEVVHGLSDGVDDALDDLCEQVENLLLRNDTLNGKAADVRLSETEIVMLPDGDKPIGAARMTFEVDYYEFIHVNPTDNFATANVKYDLAQPDGKIEAEDTLQLPTS